jgi:PIN domain nuclease of toxin-antitoxin system
MRLLLDTHILLWWLSDCRGLSPRVCKAIADPDTEVFVSAVSAWEMAIKSSLGKLTVPGNLEQALKDNGFHELPVHISHALAVEHLPHHHNDPFDRLLIAQAKIEGLTLVTCDRHIPSYDIAVLSA